MTAFTLLGDVMMDVTATVAGPIAPGSDTAARITLQPGGSAANTARWLAWSGQQSRLIGCTGDDELGRLARDALIRDGVVPLLATRASSRTGTCVVIVDPAGERTMLPDSGANALLDTGDLPAPAFTPNGHLHLSGYTLLRPSTRQVGHVACRLAREAGMTISLDASSAAPIRHQPDAFDEAYACVDLLVANAEEAMVLTGSSTTEAAIEHLVHRVPAVVVKLGSAGAIGTTGPVVHRAPALAERAVDTTGAGDAFAAGLLGAWVAGAGLELALARGNELAAIAVNRVGAGPPADQAQE